jgi:hypothetical protein
MPFMVPFDQLVLSEVEGWTVISLRALGYDIGLAGGESPGSGMNSP